MGKRGSRFTWAVSLLLFVAITSLLTQREASSQHLSQSQTVGGELQQFWQPVVPSNQKPTGVAELRELITIGKPLIFVQTVYGFHMAVDDEVPKASLLHHGTMGVLDRYIVMALDRIGPNQAVVDCGAHWGTYTMTAAARGHKVATYEPRDDNYRLVRASTVFNEFDDQIIAHHAGVWHEDTTLYLKFRKDKTIINSFDSTVTKSSTAMEGEVVIPMDVVTLDATVPRDWDVGFIKIDVQGADANAIMGAKQLIRRPGVKLMTVEFTPYNIRSRGGMDPMDLLQELDSAGYYIFEAERRRSTKQNEVGTPEDNLQRVFDGDISHRIKYDQFADFIQEYDTESHYNMNERTERIAFVYGEILAVRQSFVQSLTV